MNEEVLGILERLRGLKEEEKLFAAQQKELQLKKNKLNQQLDSILDSWRSQK